MSLFILLSHVSESFPDASGKCAAARRRLGCKPGAQEALLLQDPSHVVPMRFVRHLPACLSSSDAVASGTRC